MTRHSDSGLHIDISSSTPGALQENLIQALATSMALVATHPEATASDREATIYLSKLLRAIGPTEKQLVNGA